jgi:hypothetical protein
LGGPQSFKGRPWPRRETRLIRKGPRAGSQAGLPGPCPDREPPRVGGRWLPDPSQRDRGARDRTGHGQEPATLGLHWGRTRATIPPASSKGSGRWGVTPHIAQNTTHRRSAIVGRTTAASIVLPGVGPVLCLTGCPPEGSQHRRRDDRG